MSEPLTFSIGIDGDVTVRSYDDLIRWIEKERSRWAWMVPGDQRTDRWGLASELQSNWNGLLENIQSLKTQGQSLEFAREYLIPLSSSLILISTTNDGSLVLDIKETSGDVAAVAAYGFIKQRLTTQHMTTREEIVGLLLSALPDIRNSSDWSERLKRERTNFRMATRSLQEKLEEEMERRERSNLEITNRLRGIARRIFDVRRRKWSDTQSGWQLAADESVATFESRSIAAISSIQTTEASYREFMSLKAPVEYWDGKAAEHAGREAAARNLLFWYFPVTILVLGVVFIASGYFLLNHPDTKDSKSPVALYVVVSGGLLLLSTLSFWIGRLLTKLYLSEHHLRNDAEERATMTTTYLALTGENAAGEADRQIILNALFRSTPDGIVKEDGPADIGLQGLLAKALSK
ncbi:DUF6161 domain-containing protein [Sphingomonas sp. RIT328]|uniref:DUF6161 domain-containing protein n=1 Tax=Sphingomonas sp. RIT328 TaxID=1470591 RepID=UPI00044FD71D|nr:DUF6161 domain-containing protein [Sphingomonas sp. RIT328]EZP57284.1 hypothetical protein BW41_00127 [Sphingomonas sp. RIT328]